MHWKISLFFRQGEGILGVLDVLEASGSGDGRRRRRVRSLRICTCDRDRRCRDLRRGGERSGSGSYCVRNRSCCRSVQVLEEIRRSLDVRGERCGMLTLRLRSWL